MIQNDPQCSTQERSSPALEGPHLSQIEFFRGIRKDRILLDLGSLAISLKNVQHDSHNTDTSLGVYKTAIICGKHTCSRGSSKNFESVIPSARYSPYEYVSIVYTPTPMVKLYQ